MFPFDDVVMVSITLYPECSDKPKSSIPSANRILAYILYCIESHVFHLQHRFKRWQSGLMVVIDANYWKSEIKRP